MSDKKNQVNLTCWVSKEFAARLEARQKVQGFESRSAYIFAVLKAALDGPAETPPDPRPEHQQGEQQPDLQQEPPEQQQDERQPAAPAVTPESLREELAAVAYLLLSAQGRVGSSETARALAQGYLSGAVHREVRGP